MPSVRAGGPAPPAGTCWPPPGPPPRPRPAEAPGRAPPRPGCARRGETGGPGGRRAASGAGSKPSRGALGAACGAAAGLGEARKGNEQNRVGNSETPRSIARVLPLAPGAPAAGLGARAESRRRRLGAVAQGRGGTAVRRRGRGAKKSCPRPFGSPRRPGRGPQDAPQLRRDAQRRGRRLPLRPSSAGLAAGLTAVPPAGAPSRERRGNAAPARGRRGLT